MFEQTFKNINDILHKDAGCSSELDYVEQTSWVLFLKYLDDFEKNKKTAAELAGRQPKAIIDQQYHWDVWAAPKGRDGKIDHHSARTGDDLKEFVDHQLFPYLKKFKAEAETADTIEYKIGEIFSELKNKIQSGYNLREVINRIDELRFRSHAEKHEMSHLYEDKIKNMGNAGRNGGEYSSPLPIAEGKQSVDRISSRMLFAPGKGHVIHQNHLPEGAEICPGRRTLRPQQFLRRTMAVNLA